MLVQGAVIEMFFLNRSLNISISSFARAIRISNTSASTTMMAIIITKLL